jgi:hypothetical protein
VLISAGIYDQMVKPFILAELDKQRLDQKRYTMETTTKSGKRLIVEVKNVSFKMVGGRDHAAVFVDGKPT